MKDNNENNMDETLDNVTDTQELQGDALDGTEDVTEASGDALSEASGEEYESDSEDGADIEEDDSFDDGEDEKADAVDDAHARNGGVAKCPGGHVEGNGGSRGQALARKRGRSTQHNLLQQRGTRRKTPQVDGQPAVLPHHANQYAEAASLANHRGPRRAADAQAQAENE